MRARAALITSSFVTMAAGILKSEKCVDSCLADKRRFAHRETSLNVSEVSMGMVLAVAGAQGPPALSFWRGETCGENELEAHVGASDRLKLDAKATRNAAATYAERV